MQDGDMQGRALLGISRVDAWDRHRLYTGSFRHRLPGGVLQEGSQSLKVARLHGIMDGELEDRGHFIIRAV